jgi:ATP-dependent RNA helicase DBP3
MAAVSVRAVLFATHKSGQVISAIRPSPPATVTMSSDAHPVKRKADSGAPAGLTGDKKEKKEKKGKKEKKKHKEETKGTSAPAVPVDEEAERKRVKKEKKAAKKAAKKLAKKAAAASAADAPPSTAATASSVPPAGKKLKKDSKQGGGADAADSADGNHSNGNGHNNGNGHSNGSSAAAAGHAFVESASMRALSQADVEAHRAKHEILVLPPNGEWFKFKPMGTFEDLRPSMGVHAGPFFKYFASKKFVTPSPIQSQCWAPLLQKRDVIGIAATGSGKTLSFLVPTCLEILRLKAAEPAMKAPKAGPFCLVVAPTRELAMQSDVVASEIAQFADIQSMCIYGGVPMGQTIKRIKTEHIDVVVATCGRLVHMARDGLLSLAQIRFLVLDEADRMLDDGFAPDIKEIVGQCAPGRQTIMFSATWPDEVKKLASQLMREDVVHINVGSMDLSANARVTQTVEVFAGPAGGAKRTARLYQVLEKYHLASGCKNRVLIFVLYKKEAAWLNELLKKPGKGPNQPKYNVEAIYGDVAQEKRTQALENFRNGTVPLLIATDVAARGLDIPNVEVVINYSFPLTVEDYCHRIGRTGASACLCVYVRACVCVCACVYVRACACIFLCMCGGARAHCTTAAGWLPGYDATR